MLLLFFFCAVPPNFVSSTRSVMVSRGSDFTINATTEASPPVSNITLVKDGMIVDDDRIVPTTMSVAFRDVQCVDAGNYTWIITNAVDSDSVGFEMQVQSEF